MSKIVISILVAALFVGNVFYVSFKEVSAHNEYLEAAAAAALLPRDVQDTIANNIEIGEGSAFTPMWERKKNVHIPEEIFSEKLHSIETEIEESTELVQQMNETDIGEVVEVEEETVSPTVRATPQPTPEEKNQYAGSPLAEEILRLLNEERKKKDLPRLTLDASLTHIAQAHTEDMAKKSYMAHEDSQGCNLTCRLKQYSYKALAWAENIVFLEKEHLLSTSGVADYMMDSWMQSGGHRVNIENDAYTRVGIGVARNGSTVYVTTDFALPK